MVKLPLVENEDKYEHITPMRGNLFYKVHITNIDSLKKAIVVSFGLYK
jgi:hypothetical protein